MRSFGFEKVAKIVSSASVYFLTVMFAMLLGFMIANFRIWPYNVIDTATCMFVNLVKFNRVAPNNVYCQAPDNSLQKRVNIYEPSNMLSGYYAIFGWDDKRGITTGWLYNEKGSLQHSWHIDYKVITHRNSIGLFIIPQAFAIEKDGCIIFAIAGKYLVKLDKNSRLVWKKKGVYHHNISKADDGTYWTWLGENTAYDHYNYMVNFDSKDGSVIQKIGLVEDIIRQSGNLARLFYVTANYPFNHFDEDPYDSLNLSPQDFFHPNDVEPLPEVLAPKFPMFEAGDLLISFRNINLIMIIDRATYKIKWWKRGPWFGQHDPDFTKEGKISVYNNNSARAWSEIISIDPNNMHFEVDIGKNDFFFKADLLGKHQRLPNGNILITIPSKGQAVIVSESGDKVAEFNNVVDGGDRINAILTNAIYISPSYFSFDLSGK